MNNFTKSLARKPTSDRTTSQQRRSTNTEHGNTADESIHNAMSKSRLARTKIFTFYALFLLSGLLGFAPTLTEPISAIFLATLTFTFFLTIFDQRVSIHLNVQGLSLIAFLSVASLSVFVALNNGTPFSYWIRGYVPFTLLFIHWAALTTSTKNDAQHLIDAIQLGCVVWALKVAILGWSFLPGVLYGSIGRLTYVVPATLVPYGLIGIALALFNPSPRLKNTQPFQVGLFAFLILACGYRSQIALALVLLLVKLFRKSLWYGVVATTILATVLPVSYALFRNSPFLNARIERFEDAIDGGFQGRRALETEFALFSFRESKLVGKGLGYQIPIGAIEDNRNLDLIEASSVGYIHNVWLYLLMDLGLVGLISYCGFTFPPMIQGFKGWRDRRYSGSLDVCIAIVIASILAFSSLQACFRSVQINLVLGVLTAIASSRALTWRKGRD